MVDISVIMPVFNSEKYLADSIESILNQTYENFELIIINDGSKDNSINIINNYKKHDSRIRVISRENRGLVYSLNEGVMYSKGKFIARMDSDDISLKERLREQLTFMHEHKFVDVLGTKVITIGDFDQNVMLETQRRYGKPIESSFTLLKENVICHPSVLMRKSFIESIEGYRAKYQCAEDYDLWLRGIKKGYIIDNLEKELIKYRIHSESKVRRENANYGVIRDIVNIKLDFLEDYFKDKEINYYVWGASNGGEIAQTIINSRLKKSNFLGFVDKYKQGKLLEYNVYKPKEINRTNYNYIFIATSTGKKEVEDYLLSKGHKDVDDFISVI